MYFILHCVDMASQVSHKTSSKEITTLTHLIKALYLGKFPFRDDTEITGLCYFSSNENRIVK